MRFTKNGLLTTVALCAFATTIPVHAQNKCVVNGQTTYQDKPCGNGAQPYLDPPSNAVWSGRPPAAPPQRDAPIRKKAWRAAPETETAQQARMTEPELWKFLEEAGGRSRVKDEFETTAAFELRTRQQQQPRPFALELGWLVGNFSYDADTQTMAVDFDKIAVDRSPALSSLYSAPASVKDRSVIWLSSKEKGNTTEREGQNAFGAKRVIQHYKGNAGGLLPLHLMPAAGESKTLIKMPPEEAQKLKSFGRYRVIGVLQPSEPLVKWTYKKDATFSDPEGKEITYFMGSAQINRIEVLSKEGKTLAAIERVR